MKQLLLLLLIGLIVSTGDAQWDQIGPVALKVTALVASANGRIYAGTTANVNTYGFGVYCSIDEGETWQLMSSGLPASGSNYVTIDDLDVDGDTVYAVSDQKLYRSTNNGDSWSLFTTQVNGLKNAHTISITPVAWFASLNGILLRSINRGRSWTPVDTSISQSDIEVVYNNGVLFTTETKSTDNGVTWIVRDEPGFFGGVPNVCPWNGDTLYGTGYSGVAISTDNGASWSGGISGVTTAAGRIVKAGNRLFVWSTTGGGTGQMWGSTAPITSFTRLEVDMPGDMDMAAYSSLVHNGNILIGMGRYGIMKSTDGGNHWKMSNRGMKEYYQFKSLAASGPHLLGVGGAWVMLRSDDNGEHWVQSSRGMTITPGTSCVIMKDSVAYAGTSYSPAYVYRSTDYGVTWNESGRGIQNTINGLSFIGTTGDTIVASSTQAFYYSVDHGQNWTKGTQTWAFQQPCPRGHIAVLGTTVYTSIVDNFNAGGVYKSTDLGSTWTLMTNDSVGQPNAIAVYGNSLLVSNGYNWSGGRIMRSDDGGTTWYRVMNGIPATAAYTTGISCVGGRLLVGATAILGSRQTFTSTDGGLTWSNTSDGLPSGYAGLQCATLNDNYVYIALDNGLGIYRRPVNSFSTTGVAAGPLAPSSFELHGNYPNPFNPSTHIVFSLAAPSRVTLKVFNALGEQVAAIADNVCMDAGTHSRDFNAVGFSSGVYYYRLSVATSDLSGSGGISTTAVGRMLLLK